MQPFTAVAEVAEKVVPVVKVELEDKVDKVVMVLTHKELEVLAGKLTV